MLCAQTAAIPAERWLGQAEQAEAGREGKTARGQTASTAATSFTGSVGFTCCSIVVGREQAGKTAIPHWQGDRVGVIIDNTVVRDLTLDRTRRYQKLTTPAPTTP
jgi:hypothetical protein